MYSTMVTGALASPSAISGSAPGSRSFAMSTLPSDFGNSTLAAGVEACATSVAGFATLAAAGA